MLQVYFRAEITVSAAVVARRDFTSMESCLSWVVDQLTFRAASTPTCNVLTIARFRDVATTTTCDRTIATNAITLTSLRTCP